MGRLLAVTSGSSGGMGGARKTVPTSTSAMRVVNTPMASATLRMRRQRLPE